MCVRAQSLQSWPSLCNPMDYSPPDSSVHGILQARMGCHVLLQGIFPTQDQICVPYASCTGRWVLYHQHHLGIFSLLWINLLFGIQGGPRRLKLFYKLEVWTQEWGLFLGRACRILLSFNIWLLRYFLLGLGEHAKHILCIVVGTE